MPRGKHTIPLPGETFDDARQRNKRAYQRAYQRAWRKANPEKVREIQRKSADKRRAADPERFKEQQRKCDKRRREANPEKARQKSAQSSRKWRETNPEKARQNTLKSARKRYANARRKRLEREINELIKQGVLAEGMSVENISKLTNEKLLDRLKALRGIGADSLREQARIVAVLEERCVKSNLIGTPNERLFYRLIHEGKLLPEVWEHLWGEDVVVKALAQYPTDKQAAILNGKSVQLWTPQGVKNKTLDRLEGPDCNLVFGPDGVRTPEEQERIVTSDEFPATRPDVEERAKPRYQLRPDYARKGFQAGNLFIPTEDIVDAMAKAAGVPLEPTPDQEAVLAVKVPESVKEGLIRYARQVGKSLDQTVLELIWASGATFLKS